MNGSEEDMRGMDGSRQMSESISTFASLVASEEALNWGCEWIWKEMGAMETTDTDEMDVRQDGLMVTNEDPRVRMKDEINDT